MVRKTAEDIYTDYYLSQAGSGFSGIYSGPVYQKGYGIGSFLGGLFRTLLPLLKSGSTAVGSELLKSGANILTDISHMEDPQKVIKKRGKETIDNLGRMVGNAMFGNGYKRVAGLKRQHSHVESRKSKKRTTKRTKKETVKGKTKNTKTTARKNKPNNRNKNKTSRSKSEIYDIFS